MIVGSPTKLNLIPSGVMPVVYINQGDAGYDKEFLIYNGGSPYNVPAGVSATIRGTKADGYGVTEAAEVTEGSNLVTVTITEQMVAAAGENLYELVFVDTDDLRVASINMIWAVKKDALGDSVISDSDLDYASQVLNQLQSVSAYKAQLDINTNGLATETAARIAADTTLQSNINAEALTRGSTDASLQSQINQLIAPTGTAPSAAEVENARIGADGKTYVTLGDAIRGQINDVNDTLEFVGAQAGVGTTNLITSISSGYYATSDGELVSNANFSHADINVSGLKAVYIDGTLHTYTPAQYPHAGVFFDANGDFLKSIAAEYGSTPSQPYKLNVPQGAVKLGLNTDYKASNYPSSIPDGLVCYSINDAFVKWSELSSGNKKLKIIAGVIRNSGNGWEFINDANHEPLNLAAVSVNQSGQIVLNYGFTAKKVLTLVACPDETFADDYTVGGSVGLSETILNVYSIPKTVGGRVFYNNNAGVWNYATYANFTNASFNTANGVLTLTHETLASYPAKEKFFVSANGYNCQVFTNAMSDNTIGIMFPDSNGVAKKTPDGNMDAYITRQLPKRFVNANDIVDAGGNFWIFGVMEI